MEDYRQKFQELLKSLFQFECSDLDFGIYRIMNYKRDAIHKFIEKDLPNAISKELDSGVLADQSEAAQQLEELIQRIKENIDEDAFDEQGNLKQEHHKTKRGKEYLKLKEKGSGAKPKPALETAIYNHLYSFFTRYYDSGDFLSKRRYSKKEKYAIPYNGEEVYLHWANKDQYYIKTAEYFNDYKFISDGITVHFKIKQADIEQNNVKGDKRFFIPLCKEASFDKKAKEILIPVEYRPLTEQEEISYGGKNQQDKINAEAIETIAKVFKDEDKALAVLFAEKRKTTDDESVSFLEHHLRQYTRRNNSDFFIHKDLKSFLEKELDFYLKNEVLNLDEVGTADETRADGWFQLMRIIKAVGHSIIAFVAQIENFQKKLFEKKKFITETQYCITVKNIPESFYKEVSENQAQWDEWKELFHIDENGKDLFTAKDKTQRRIDFLKHNPTLVLDTKYFSEDFTGRLLACFENFDEMIDGLLVNSENFQALNILREIFRGKVKCVYIDPPFNLGNEAEFLYRVDYKDSTWITLLENRLLSAKYYLGAESSIFVRCSYDGNMLLRLLLNSVFGANNFRNEIVVRRAELSKGDLNKQFHSVKSLTVNYDNIYWYSANQEARFGKVLKPTSEKQSQSHWHSFWKAENRPKLRYEILGIDLSEHYGQWMWKKVRAFKAVENYKSFLANSNKTGESLEEYWERTGRKLEFVRREGDGYSSIKYWIPPRSYVMADNNWLDIKGYANTWDFRTENSEILLKRIIESLTQEGETVFDFFLGSGTTTAVAHKLKRKWIGVEVGKQFDSVIIPRMKNVLFGDKSGISSEAEWKGGGCFKYIVLESYEDALNNIRFEDAKGALLKFDDYLLEYMLDFEAKGSETFLNVEKLSSPFDYKLLIHNEGETKEKPVDLPETFNYLLGLNVDSRKVYRNGDNKYVVYRGTIDHKNIAVIWRETKDWKKQEYEQDKKFVTENKITDGIDEIFVNGDSFIPNAKSLDPIFKNRMFAGS